MHPCSSRHATGLMAVILLLSLTAIACGDGIAERTEGTLQLSGQGGANAKFIAFPSTAPGFKSPADSAIFIKNGGKGTLKITSVTWEGDATEYIRPKGEIRETFDLTPDQEERIQFELAVPRPAESDAPLTCPDPPGGFPAELASSGGRYCGHLKVTSNAREGATDIIYFLVSQSDGKIKVEPTVLNFTSPQVGQTQTATLTISNVATNGNLSLDRINKIDFPGTSSSDFQIEGFPFPVDLSPAETVTYQIIYTPTSDTAANGRLEVKSNDPSAPTTIVVVNTGTATAAQIAVDPTSLTFPDAAPGAPQTHEITVTNGGGGAPLTVTQMVVLPSEAQAAYTILWDKTDSGTFVPWVQGDQDVVARQNSTVYQIRYEPMEAGQSVSGRLRISTNAANVPNGEANVTLSGGAAAPDGLVSPSTIIFNVAPGASETRAFSVANGGLAPLEITGVTLNNLDGGEFSVSPDPNSGITVGAGEVQAFDVVFDRQANDIGQDVGDIVLMTNNPFNSGELVVSVRNNNGENAISPVATITQTPDGNVPAGTAITFDGSGSTTQNGTIAYYIWTLLDAPDGSTARFGRENDPTATFTPDLPGNYRVQLVVGNNRNPPLEGSTTRNVTISE